MDIDRQVILVSRRNALPGTVGVAPRFACHASFPRRWSFFLENRVGPDFSDLFGVVPGEFRVLRTLGRRAVFQGDAICADANDIEHDLEIIHEGCCKEIPSLVVAFVRVSSDRRRGVGSFPDGADDEVARNATTARDEDRPHRRGLLCPDGARHISAAVTSLVAWHVTHVPVSSRGRRRSWGSIPWKARNRHFLHVRTWLSTDVRPSHPCWARSGWY